LEYIQIGLLCSGIIRPPIKKEDIMSNSSGKHNCPLLNFFKSCGCCGDKASKPADHSHAQGKSCCGHEHDHPHDDHAHSCEAATKPTAVPPATGTDDAESAINADLQSIDKDIKAFMDRQPPKQDERSGATDLSMPFFDQAAIEDKAYVEARDEQRKAIVAAEGEEAAAGRAGWTYDDQAVNLVDNMPHSSLQSMEDSDLMSARLSTEPWSDDYWAMYLGILGKRYADPNFPKSMDWQENYDYVQSRSTADILADGDATAIDQLSPAEKYDILVGDSNYTLTRKMWAEGERYKRASDQVAKWMGICHGWAPAAYMLPRPEKAVNVLAADGTTMLTFYPSDIKGLASLLWAKVNPRSRFVGGRCNDKNPPTDPDNKRVLSNNCFDTNPGTWHLAVVNQIGASERSMVIDATFDHEVWNQPVVGYRYRYFNPQEMYYRSSLAAATVSQSSFSNDRFASYRSPKTDSMVGIVMDVSYTVETQPSQSTTDSPEADAIKTVTYYYDLELDFSGKIIGGEWYFNRHPDFLWTPAPDDRAQTSSEPDGSWAEGEPMPVNWQRAAASASERQHAPLAAIVERLIELAAS
jgi:hypothetical protein